MRTATILVMLVSAAVLTPASFAATDSPADHYVSPQGNDPGAGTKAAPWKTLAKACEQAGPGDTIYLHGGVYRETLTPKRSGEPGKPIRFRAVPGEKPVISGADLLAGTWQSSRGNIFVLKTDRKFVQLFVDGQMMPEARWPNSAPGQWMTYTRATAGIGTGYETLNDPQLPAGDWNGGVVLVWPGSSWVSATRRIADYQPGKSLRFDPILKPKRRDEFHAADPYLPRQGNRYVLVGSLAGLDSPGEWFLDEAAGAVYLWTPDGTSPQKHVVEVRQRDYACDLRKRALIEVQGIDILAGAVTMDAAHDCLLEDCRMRYVEHYRECGLERTPPALNVMTGRNNEWRRCLVAYAATSALHIGGEDNRLVDCVLHDVNYLGTGRGGLDLGHSVGAQVRHCTICRTGRDTVHHGGSKRLRFEYNDLYHGNMLNNDAAAIYCWGTDGQGGVIAYNWVHDNLGESTCGIYLDNFSKNFIVHHNVVWNCTGSGVRLNCDALDHQVYNNTIQQVREPFGTYTYAAYAPTMKGTRIINNLVNEAIHPKNPSEFVQGPLGPELHHNAPGAVDRDGYPAAGSTAIDAGVVLPGITDGCRGKAPDLGAYEFGGPRWKAGADWQDPDLAPAPAKNLHYTPRGPITEQTMIREGLVLWLDADDPATLELKPDGTVLVWRDKSSGRHEATSSKPTSSVKLAAHGLNGRSVVRGSGAGNLQVDLPRRGPGAVTVLVVSQASEASRRSWQRLIQCRAGEGKSWELPNWEILRPDGKQSVAYTPRLFTVSHRDGAAFGPITLAGASADVAEVLVFERSLRFDELEALAKYLQTKWGAQP